MSVGEGPLISAVDARSFLRRNGHGPCRPPSVACSRQKGAPSPAPPPSPKPAIRGWGIWGRTGSGISCGRGSLFCYRGKAMIMSSRPAVSGLFFKSRMLRHGANPQDDCFLSLLSPATRSRHVSPASPPADRPLPFGHRSRLRRAGVRRKWPSPVLRHQCGRRDRLCPAAFVLRPVFRPSRPAAMAGQSRTQGLRRLPQQAPSASRRPAPSSPAPHPAGRLLASGPSRLRTPPCSPLRRSPQSGRCIMWGTPVLPNRGPGTRCMAAPSA